MPELPDIIVYLESLAGHVAGQQLRGYALRSPFVLRTVDPPPDAAIGRTLAGVERLGKRIVLGFDEELYFVIHLMIAGRLRWRASGAGKKVPASLVIAEFQFDDGTLFLTEAGTKKRASLYTLKRALTDPRLFDGIGNAYSDEILHRARLSPLRLTSKLADGEIERLHEATRETLVEWTARLRADAAGEFPEKVTAFHEEMAVHGRFGKPCPACGAPVQRIRYRDNETNYCARCQTQGRVLADRALSRLLRQDWPRTIEELEG